MGFFQIENNKSQEYNIRSLFDFMRGCIYMVPELFGLEHILYIVISTLIGGLGLFFAYKYAKTEKVQNIIIKSLAIALLISIITNRLSQVFRDNDVRWYLIIPDSFCGMTSLMLGLAVLFGKKNNDILHGLWLLGIFGGISTVIYASFVGQNESFFYLPTISGLVHHSICAIVVVAIIMFKYIDITYKKWYCSAFCFTCYITVGAFLMHTFNLNDAFHIVEPLIPGTPLTAWVMAPMYAVGYAGIVFGIELVRRKKN